MSTSLLYHSFGIRGYEYRRTDFFEGRVAFCIEQPRARYRCSECGSAAVHAQGHKERLLQSVPIGLKPTFVFAGSDHRLRQVPHRQAGGRGGRSGASPRSQALGGGGR